jgi:hypothetical protein
LTSLEKTELDGGTDNLNMSKPRGYWTKERVAEAARQFEGRKAFAKRCSSAYSKAAREGWLDEVCAHMEDKRDGNPKWTKELCAAEAAKCTSRSEFRTKSSAAFSAAERHGWLREITPHIKYTPKGYWTEARLKSEAAKFDHLRDFRKHAASAYGKAKAIGLFDEITAHMSRDLAPRKYWTKDRLLREAKKYSSRKEFRNGSAGAYAAATKRDDYDEIVSHMPHRAPRTYRWTERKVLAEAMKYEVEQHFRKQSSGAFKAAVRLGIVAKATAHMKKPWTVEAVMEQSKAYTSRTEWFENRPLSGAAERLGIWEQAQAHMPYGHSGFDANKPARLYYLRVEMDGRALYKIGITNRNAMERFRGRNNGATIKRLRYWKFEKGKDARDLENLVKAHCAEHLYVGEPILKDGNTELFAVDILGLDPESPEPRHPIVDDILKEATEIPS